MGNLKWIATPSTYRFADCEFGRYQIIGRGGRRLRVTDPVGLVLIHPEHRSIADAKGWAESDYARRIAKIAAANGYVRLEPGQVVVKGDDIKELLHLWISHGPRFAEINRVMRAFAGAVALVECPICRGSGTIRVPHSMKPFALEYIDHCDNCKGEGFVSVALDASEVKL